MEGGEWIAKEIKTSQIFLRKRKEVKSFIEIIIPKNVNLNLDVYQGWIILVEISIIKKIKKSSNQHNLNNKVF